MPNRNERVKNPGPLIVSGGAAKSNKNKGLPQQQKQPKQDGKKQNKNENEPAESTPRGSSEARERETTVIDEVVRRKGDDGQAENGREARLS